MQYESSADLPARKMARMAAALRGRECRSAVRSLDRQLKW